MKGKGEITRQKIVAAAAPIFNQRGYEGCSMRDLMEATGLEKGGIYRHFSSKEELAAEAFRYSLDQAAKLRTEYIEGARDSVDLLRKLIKRFVVTRSSLPGGCPLMNTAIDSDDGNPTLRRMAVETMQDWKQRVEAIVRSGIRAGEIRKGTSPRRVANMCIATLEGALMISRLEGTRTALEDAQEVLGLLLDQIETNQASAEIALIVASATVVSAQRAASRRPPRSARGSRRSPGRPR